jgi:hypothetical protein
MRVHMHTYTHACNMYACAYTCTYTQTCIKIHTHAHVHKSIHAYVYTHTRTHPPPSYTHSTKPATQFNKSNGTTAADPYPASGRDVGRLTRASTSPTQRTESGTNIWALLKNVPVSSEVLFIPLCV